MNNVLLDPLPTGYEADDGTFYALNFDFRIGIQVCLIQDDPELDSLEKFLLMQDLIFVEDRPDDPEIINSCISFYINGWYLDNHIDVRKKDIKSSDFNIDQWRIYAAFLSQYQIDLNSIEEMHYWVFMGLLSNLDECSYTRVLDIRTKKVPKGLKGEDLQNFNDAKATYKLGVPMTKEDKDAQDYMMDNFFIKNIGGSGDTAEISEEEQKRIEKFESYADK